MPQPLVSVIVPAYNAVSYTHLVMPAPEPVGS